jgi:membrane protein YqaA with SNARE-associated domain
LIYQYFILFFWSFVAATFFPISSEIFLANIIRQNNLILIPVIVATIGNVLGGIVTFYMGWIGGEIALKKTSIKNKNRFDKSQKIIQKYGTYSMILAWTPFIGDIIVLLGGAFKLPVLSSILWMTIGKFLRYLIFAFSIVGLLEKFF